MSNLFAIVFVRQLFYKDEFARKISLKNMFLNITGVMSGSRWKELPVLWMMWILKLSRDSSLLIWVTMDPGNLPLPNI